MEAAAGVFGNSQLRRRARKPTPVRDAFKTDIPDIKVSPRAAVTDFKIWHGPQNRCIDQLLQARLASMHQVAKLQDVHSKTTFACIFCNLLCLTDGGLPCSVMPGSSCDRPICSDPVNFRKRHHAIREGRDESPRQLSQGLICFGGDSCL
jgi:hypothetical protein